MPNDTMGGNYSTLTTQDPSEPGILASFKNTSTSTRHGISTAGDNYGGCSSGSGGGGSGLHRIAGRFSAGFDGGQPRL